MICLQLRRWPFFTAGVDVPHTRTTVVDQAWLLPHPLLEVTLDDSFLFTCRGERSYTNSTDERSVSRNGPPIVVLNVPDEALAHEESSSKVEKGTRKQPLLFLTEELEELHPQHVLTCGVPDRDSNETKVPAQGHRDD